MAPLPVLTPTPNKSLHQGQLRAVTVSITLGALLMTPLSPLTHAPSYAAGPSDIATSGGSVTDHLGYRYHAFTHSGAVAQSTTSALEVVGGSVTADILVVAGGGGGGRNRAGGGGAGGLLLITNETLASGSHQVIVGGGGKGGSKPEPDWKDAEASPGCRGEGSSFGATTTTGGGGGGASASSPVWVDCNGNPLAADYGPKGGDGGSGGGGAYTNGVGGSGVAGQGTNGRSVVNSPGGGGGGAGAAGGTVRSQGDGGAGATGDTVTAMGQATSLGQPVGGSVYFAGGGGGFSGGVGGSGGGGNSGVAGTPHTGGGGGACASISCNGGSPGGSGVVIARYAVPHFTAMSTPHVASDPLDIGIEQGDAVPDVAVTGAVQVVLVSGNLPTGVTLNSVISGNAMSFTGSVSTPGTYDFTVRAYQNDSGPSVFTDRRIVLSVDADQTLSFPEVASKDLRNPSLSLTATSVVSGTSDPTGLSASWASADTNVCTVSSSGEVTLVARGSCGITASQAGGAGNGYTVNAATPVTRTFSVYDTALAALSLSRGTLTPAVAAGVTNYQSNVGNEVSSLTLTAVPRFAGATMTLGGQPLSSGQGSNPLSLSVGANQLTLVVADGDQQNTVVILVNRAAPPRPTSDPPPTTTADRFAPGGGVLNVGRPRPPSSSNLNATIAQSPALPGGIPPRPSDEPTASIGGVPSAVTTTPVGERGVRVTAGTVDVGLGVTDPSRGGLQTGQGGTPELVVQLGSQTQISGRGVAPGSFLQAFLPLGGDNAVELGRIQADGTGAFSGTAVLATAPNREPLPVGRQVLQILGVDVSGNQTVINMTITIAQPPPQPEVNREEAALPSLTPGQSIATRAGLPTSVDISTVPEENRTLIRGEGWSMTIDVPRSGVGANRGGAQGASLTLVRDQNAEVSGSGFMPFTRADVWLFSTPTLLGTVDIDGNGEFRGVVSIDGTVVAAGDHTLQLQGVGEDGYVRAANLGVVVNDEAEAVPEPTATRSLAGMFWAMGVAGGILVAAGLWWLFRRRASIVT